MIASVMSAPIAVEGCRGFHRVYHEAEARAGCEHREFLGAWAAWWCIGHLKQDIVSYSHVKPLVGIDVLT